MPIEVIAADLASPAHRVAIVELLDLYAQDEMGSRSPLPKDVCDALPGKLAELPTARVWLAYDGNVPVGLCIAFLGFSTFQARPLLNLHDVAVRPGHRGGGVGKKLLAAAEAEALKLGCCRVTLEVRTDNDPAKRCYAACGFAPGSPVQEFWMKPLA